MMNDINAGALKRIIRNLGTVVGAIVFVYNTCIRILEGAGLWAIFGISLLILCLIFRRVFRVVVKVVKVVFICGALFIWFFFFIED